MSTNIAGPEFSRPIRAHEVGQRRQHNLGATAPERAALARRFDLLILERLEANLELRADTGTATGAGSTVIHVTGHISAAGTQPCVATQAPVPFTIAEPLTLRLIPEAPESEDIELSEHDLDSEPLTSDIIDLGEIIAQALGLALDPYPRSSESAPGLLTEAEAHAAASPFAILKKP